jgi:hypothetical protein
MSDEEFKSIQQLDYWIKRAKDAESQLASLTEENEQLRAVVGAAKAVRAIYDGAGSERNRALDDAYAQVMTDLLDALCAALDNHVDRPVAE